MGNGIGRLNVCFAGDAGEISRRRRHDIAVYLTDPLDEGFGHSFCYVKPDPSRLSYSKAQSDEQAAAPFRTISGASISANTYTPLSTALIDFYQYQNAAFDKASSFQSSDSFASIPLQPIPRSSIPSVRSGPVLPSSGVTWGSGPIERGFLSGPMERSFISGPLEGQYDQIQRYKPKSKKWGLVKMFKKAIAKSTELSAEEGKGELNWGNGLDKNNENFGSNNLSSQLSLCEDDDDNEGHNVQWAQGKAGEDRVHVVVSEEHGWVFVGIYDGFNGPDATDYLLTNLYTNVSKELEELDLLTNLDSVNGVCGQGDDQKDFPCRFGFGGVVNHGDVLRALSEGLRKTEEAYLEVADLMVAENPELALMGSCVLAMLMKGDDVYLMNVGDSRAVLARKAEPSLGIGKTVNELEVLDGYEFESLLSLASCQLTVDHSTSVQEEVLRIKREHPDDSSAVTNDRVKGSLKVTRAFGAGFLKQPKWNDALLKMFRIDYVGTSPYLNCSPSVHHHKLGPKDKFLILSSDGLYQYFTNQEAVSEVEMFISSFPEGDPAQHLVEEVLFRAAKKAGMDFRELLDIPQGDRRKYHDDVSIIIISFEGRIWRSSV
ncbi:hypothetical protein RJ639_020916 [Escallonia herrerae]|uniref:protein-serine/threonine phosphatase n=1 Tax=Escallonia herrerae TaxID=1293975 RepID=A0AA88V553_9ASTE|nr:hypothetical protein RJ639_020916 [Escallonia herrerae]